MRKIILILTLAGLIAACDNGVALHKKVPKDIIPVDTMIMAMSDLIVIENVLQRDFPILITQSKYITNSGDSVLKNHGLTFDRYKNSLEYYTFYQDTLDYIYDRMIDRISNDLNTIQN